MDEVQRKDACSFWLTPEQAARVMQMERNGQAVIAQLVWGDDGRVVCRAKVVTHKQAHRVQKIFMPEHIGASFDSRALEDALVMP